jgi:hypothetical protein
VAPAVAIALLVLLGLAVLAGITAMARAWWVTRYQAPEPVRHLAAPTNTNSTTRKEVA